MATTLSDTRPSFARLTESRKTRSWRAALPAVVVIVAFVALIGYLASSLSSYSQRASVAERDANQYREQLTAMGKQVGDLQKEVTLDRSPGRTTVILQAAAPIGRKGAAAPADKAWAAVTWGELPSGKSWIRVNAYGLSQSAEAGKAYHVWMQPQTGDPIDVGTLEIDQNGSGFAMKSDLPGIDQGKAVMLTADPDKAKQPGDVIAKADLPKLLPTMTAPPKAQENQARPGDDTQQMHQGK
jgi:hypothetical protein